MSMALWQRTPPVLRAAIISGSVMSIADVLCQKVQARDAKNFKVDWQRTARFGIVGLTIHGPFFFLGFGALDKKFGPAANFKTALTKTMTGQFTLFPTYLAAFFMAMGALEGKGFQGGIDKIQGSYMETYLRGSVFWPLANIINFRFVPTSQRVLYVNFCGLIWNTYLSWVNSNKPQALQE